MASPPRDSSTPSPPPNDPEKSAVATAARKPDELTTAKEDAHAVDGGSLRAGEGEDILARQDLDPALNLKMHLVNNVSPVRSPLMMPRTLLFEGG